MKTTETLNVEDFKVCVALSNNEFDSHDFIKIYAGIYAAKYVAMLRLCGGDFTIVDRDMANFLKSNAATLDIIRLSGDVESENIIGNISPNATWKKA